MTTPTREQVVQWAEQAGFGNAQENLYFLNAFAEFARADLEATIAEQEAENARLKEHQCKSVCVFHEGDSIITLQQQLVKSKAENVSLKLEQTMRNAGANLDMFNAEPARCRACLL